MQGLSNIRGYLIFVCSVAFINAQEAGPLINSHAQLLQSFQNEMKSLEAAAHRVNALLTDPNLTKQAEEPVTPVKETKPFEFTVLADPNILQNGVVKKEQEEVATTEASTDAPKQPENNEELIKNPLQNFGSFFSSFGKPSFQTPWWRGKNVCVQKTENVEDGKKNEDGKNQEPQFIVFGTGSFERCRQTANKYVCTTVVSTPESTRTSTVTYECCEGFRREGNECVEGDFQEKLSISDDSSSNNNNNYNFNNNDNNYKSEELKGNHFETENHKNSFVPIKVQIPLEVTTVMDKKNMENDDSKSYSSQSEEAEDGNPVWLHNFLNSESFLRGIRV